MNVFSAFNGIGCGFVALREAGVNVDKYYSSEIDKRAIKVNDKNWPKTIQFGDISKIKAEHFLSPIHLLMGGSPCQDLSIAGKGAGLAGVRSGLFFEFVRLIKELKPQYFFLENVASMKKHDKEKITEILGIEPYFFDSALVSAQTRKRLYWFGQIINGIPHRIELDLPTEDRGITIADILEYDENGYVHEFRGEQHKYRKINKVSCIDANYYKGIDNHQARTCVKVGENGNKFESSGRIYHPFAKTPSIDTQSGGD